MHGNLKNYKIKLNKIVKAKRELKKILVLVTNFYKGNKSQVARRKSQILLIKQSHLKIFNLISLTSPNGNFFL